MKKTLKKIVKFTGITVGALLLIFIGLVAYFNLIRVFDINKQAKHVDGLRVLYEQDYASVDEQQFANFDLYNNDSEAKRNPAPGYSQ